MTSTVFDLAGERERREAAAREATGTPPVLRLPTGDFTLPVEIPMDVFGPFLAVSEDVSLLVRQVYMVWQAGGEDRAATQILMDILGANPNLPTEIIDAARSSFRLLAGDDAYNALIVTRPRWADLAALVRWLTSVYGVGLGEASEPRGSAKTVGAKSSSTSSKRGSTRVVSGPDLTEGTYQPLVRSVPAGS